jgi:3-oxoadipate enol-lactonase
MAVRRKTKMKRTMIVLCLNALLTLNLCAQGFDNIPSIAVDTGYVHVDGGRLFYEIAGEGENIVLIHDGMVHREIWNEQFPVLAKDHRVVRYDRQGYGKSSDPQGSYSHIEDLNQIFVQLKIDKAIIFGMSSGGGLAIDFTLKYPEKVSALVLVGAVVSGYGYSPHMMNRGGHLKSLAELSDPQKVIQYFVWEDPYEIYSENTRAKEMVVKLLEANQHQDMGGTLIPPDRPAARFLSEIKVPTLVLVGEYDIPDVHAHAGVIQFGIPDAKREIILKSGHLIPLEQPEAFNASVLKFLNRAELFNILHSQGVNAAVQYFNTKHEREPDVVLFEELEMNALGYQYLSDGKIKEAIELFTLNTIAFPDAWNTYDSLGESYWKDGQIDNAIKNYERSLQLNPDNEYARIALKELKGLK